MCNLGLLVGGCGGTVVPPHGAESVERADGGLSQTTGDQGGGSVSSLETTEEVVETADPLP